MENSSIKLTDQQHIFVALSDWCPACLEYKIVLSKIISTFSLKIDFISPSKLNIGVIPTTLFVNGDVINRVDGFMSCEKFIKAVKDFLS